MKPTLWLVEDEPSIADTLIYTLESEGFQVRWFERGEPALQALAQGAPALAILDVGLPDINGFELCRRLLAQAEDLPVLFLTARSDELDRLIGLEIGADDYVVKPFSPREVVARVRAILKRSGRAAAAPDGEFAVDLARLQIAYRGQPLKLTALEFRLLQQLVSAPERVFSREELLAAVGAATEAGYERNVTSLIRRRPLCSGQ